MGWEIDNIGEQARSVTLDAGPYLMNSRINGSIGRRLSMLFKNVIQEWTLKFWEGCLMLKPLPVAVGSGNSSG